MADDMRIKAEVVLELDEASLNDVAQKVSETLDKGVESGTKAGASKGAPRRQSETEDAATTAGGKMKARTGDEIRQAADDARMQRMSDAMRRIQTAAQAGRDIGSGRVISGAQGAAQATNLGVLMRGRGASTAAGTTAGTAAQAGTRAGATAAAGGTATAATGASGAAAGGASGGLMAAALNPITLAVAGIVVAVGGMAFAAKKIYEYMSGRLDSLLQKAYASPAAAGLALREQVRQQRRDFAIGQQTAGTSSGIQALRNQLRDQLARIQILITNVVNTVAFKYLAGLTAILTRILDALPFMPDLDDRGVNVGFRDAINDIVHRNFDMDLAGTP